MLFHFKRGMAKIQILLALTFDGFLPRSHETLMRWVEGNTRHGFPLWQAKASFSIYPHYGLIDLLDVADKHDGECIYLAEIRDKDSAEYAGGLLRYNLVDEIVLYLLPLSYGKGVSLAEGFQPGRWKLHACKSFSNGICRLVYRRKG
ncbi:hypothetical protein JQN09_13590 [Phocaeicola dorei]|nr:hypothetical protein [Phocaeicola dorei]MBT1312950.1 hypothetical protein [Phocaeicola dorei]